MEQVPKAVKDSRAARAAQAAETLHQAYLSGCVGQVYPVLYEQMADGRFQGHAPNYMTVAAVEGGAHNQVLPTRIIGVEDGILLGEIISG